MIYRDRFRPSQSGTRFRWADARRHLRRTMCGASAGVTCASRAGVDGDIGPASEGSALWTGLRLDDMGDFDDGYSPGLPSHVWAWRPRPHMAGHMWAWRPRPHMAGHMWAWRPRPHMAGHMWAWRPRPHMPLLGAWAAPLRCLGYPSHGRGWHLFAPDFPCFPLHSGGDRLTQEDRLASRGRCRAGRR